MAAESTDLVSVITSDHGEQLWEHGSWRHREVESVFKELESKEGSPSHRCDLPTT